MTITTLVGYTGTGLQGRIDAYRDSSDRLFSLALQQDRTAGASRNGNDTSTRVTLSSTPHGDAPVYYDPRAANGFARMWSAPVDPEDPVSALMARNRAEPSSRLADQWRGLGGAALKRFAETGANYTQSLVDGIGLSDEERADPMVTDEVRAARLAPLLTQQAADLQNLANPSNPAATLTIQTRSGQTVALDIVVGEDVSAGRGLKVTLTASGELTETERAAVAQLADGLDRALEGLGQEGPKAAPQFDLSGLVGYDRSVLASIDLAVDTHSEYRSLSSFSLQLNDAQQSVAVKSADGEMHLSVDPRTPLANTPARQRDLALLEALERIDAAGERGHARQPLVDQMKSAFAAFQMVATQDKSGPPQEDNDTTTAPFDDDPAPADARAQRRAEVDAAVTTQLSGLADFDAGFGGTTWQDNRYEQRNEGGSMNYTLSQQTVKGQTPHGHPSLAQTVSEGLDAEIDAAPHPDLPVDTDSGTYQHTRVHDRREVTTLIESTIDGITRALRRTNERLFREVTDYEDRVIVHRDTQPLQRGGIETLPLSRRPVGFTPAIA